MRRGIEWKDCVEQEKAASGAQERTLRFARANLKIRPYAQNEFVWKAKTEANRREWCKGGQ